MKLFKIPAKNEVSEDNQKIFSQLENGLGFVPNLYAFYAKSKTALKDYLGFQNRKTSISKKDQEVVNLVVSQYNECYYCQSAHTAIAGLNGFNNDQILEIRSGSASFDERANAIARFTLAMVSQKGQISQRDKNDFFEAGFSEENMIDIIINIGSKTISNYIHNVAQFELDFPQAPKLEGMAAAAR
jgi:uncharacterized peroxidase-related enzyme